MRNSWRLREPGSASGHSRRSSSAPRSLRWRRPHACGLPASGSAPVRHFPSARSLLSPPGSYGFSAHSCFDVGDAIGRSSPSCGNAPPPPILAARATREDGVMANQSYIYLGLAGETGAGRVVHSGLFRLADGSPEWEALQQGLPEMPAVRALAVHPERPEILYAGTQSGPYRSADRGEHWEKV